jgi:hypothetical protein
VPTSTKPYVDWSLLCNFLSVIGKHTLTQSAKSIKFTRKALGKLEFYCIELTLCKTHPIFCKEFRNLSEVFCYASFMRAYKTKAGKIPGTDFHEVKQIALEIFKKIKKEN